MTSATSIFFGSVGAFVLYIIYGAFSQNSVLGRGLGSSRLTKLISDEDSDTGIFAVLLFTVQVLAGALGWVTDRWVMPLFAGHWRVHFRPLMMVLCISAVFFAIFLAVVELLPGVIARRVVRQLPIAAYNCSIMGTLLLTGNQSYGFGQTMAFSIGSALGFLMALLLMAEGSRKLKDAPLSESFRGLPATLVYLGILSLMIYSFTGHGLTV